MTRSALEWVQEGLALHKAGRAEDAAGFYERALRVDPRSFDALQLLALVRFRSGQLDLGIQLFERALAIAPRHASTLNNYGNALLAAGRWSEASAAYQSAIANSPKPPPVIFRNLGVALSEAGSDEAAKGFLERALAGDPTDREALNRLAGLSVKWRDWARAEALYSQSLRHHDSLAVRLARLVVRQNLVLWDGWAEEVAHVTGSEPADDEQVDPLKLMFLVDAPLTQRRYAEAFASYGRRRNPTDEARRASPPVSAPQRRLRLGYLSFDIRRHPVAQLVAGVLEAHDRNAFEVTVHALGPDCGDAERLRIRDACEHFVVHANRTEAESVEIIRAADHDILVDLMGYTRDARPGILIQRPARVHLGWLGYPGTLGTGMLDALIADDYVTPAGCEPYYAEPLLRMPRCYLPADRSRQVNAPQPREAYGFTDTDVIMACFCQLQKITPDVFDLWLQTMAAAPSLVLWLFDAQAAVAERLRQRAAAGGVDASRIRFAGFVPDHADHLARYAVADFAVDTFPYGSHTTAIDALWVGCPLIAWSGEGFASRVSGSVLTAGGCAELIANSADEYRDLILGLANDPLQRRVLRQELLLKRTSSSLFDVAQFTRRYEALLCQAAGQGTSAPRCPAANGP